MRLASCIVATVTAVVGRSKFAWHYSSMRIIMQPLIFLKGIKTVIACSPTFWGTVCSYPVRNFDCFRAPIQTTIKLLSNIFKNEMLGGSCMQGGLGGSCMQGGAGG